MSPCHLISALFPPSQATYFDTRNGMLGPDYSTKFSPWLAAGCLSPRTVAAEIGKYEKQRTSNKSTYWRVQWAAGTGTGNPSCAADAFLWVPSAVVSPSPLRAPRILSHQ